MNAIMDKGEKILTFCSQNSILVKCPTYTVMVVVINVHLEINSWR